MSWALTTHRAPAKGSLWGGPREGALEAWSQGKEHAGKGEARPGVSGQGRAAPAPQSPPEPWGYSWQGWPYQLPSMEGSLPALSSMGDFSTGQAPRVRKRQSPSSFQRPLPSHQTICSLACRAWRKVGTQPQSV